MATRDTSCRRAPMRSATRRRPAACSTESAGRPGDHSRRRDRLTLRQPRAAPRRPGGRARSRRRQPRRADADRESGGGAPVPSRRGGSGPDHGRPPRTRLLAPARHDRGRGPRAAAHGTRWGCGVREGDRQARSRHRPMTSWLAGMVPMRSPLTRFASRRALGGGCSWPSIISLSRNPSLVNLIDIHSTFAGLRPFSIEMQRLLL